MQTMYPGQPNSPRTTLAQAIDATQTTIEVTDGMKLPDAPNIAVIGTDENAETILYESKEGNILSNVTRAFQGTARSWPAGSPIARNFTAYDYDALRQNLSAHLAETTQNAHFAKNIGIEDAAGNFTATDVEGALAELFTSVSDGKDLIGGAITDVDPSIVIPPYPTFQQLADAIRQISTGKKWASGIETSRNFTSPELDFVPNIVIVVANRPITYYTEPGAIIMRGWNNSLNFMGASPAANLYISLYPAGHMFHKRFYFSAGNYHVQEGYLWYALE